MVRASIADGALDECIWKGEVKTSTTIALGRMLLGSPAAYAQTEQPTPYHHYQVHPRHVLIITTSGRTTRPRRPRRPLSGRAERLRLCLPLRQSRCSSPILIPETATTTGSAAIPTTA